MLPKAKRRAAVCPLLSSPLYVLLDVSKKFLLLHMICFNFVINLVNKMLLGCNFSFANILGFKIWGINRSHLLYPLCQDQFFWCKER